MKKLLYCIRNLRTKSLFSVLHLYCRETVLDVGGREFYRMAQKKGVTFDSWTVLESSPQWIRSDTTNVRFVLGDGCKMDFPADSFDTVLNVQVLEHVFEPMAMVREMARVLKKNGHLICLIPQTSVIHGAPQHYYNFTRFWIEEAMQRVGLEILELKPMGGVWSSMASHLVYFFLQSMRFPGMAAKECRRNPLFYLLYPLMVLFALLAMPVCLFLSLGDLTEEPNNHLVVARKK